MAAGTVLQARAEGTGVVAVREPPGPTAELVELTGQLRGAAAERDPSVVDAAQLRERMTARTDSAKLAELDRAYAGALAAYQSGEFAGSVRTLRGVVDDLEKLPDSPEAFQQWTRAMLRLARSEQTLGHKDKAAEVIDQLVRAAPYVEVDKLQYPPSFAKQIKAAQDKLRAQATRKLTVQSTAKGARVFVQGRDVGVAPLTVDVPPGRYRVSGALGELRVPRQDVDVKDDSQTVMLDFGVAEALRPALGPGLALPAGERGRSLVSAAKFLGVDKLIAVSQPEPQVLAAQVVDAQRGQVAREGRVRLVKGAVPADAMKALATYLISGQASKLVGVEGAAPPEPEVEKPVVAAKPPAKAKATAPVTAGAPAPLAVQTQPKKGSSGMKWLGIGSGVVALGLAGFGVAEGLSAKSSYNDANGMLLGNRTLAQGADPVRYNQLVKDGDSARTKAYIGAGGAVAFAALAGLFLVLGSGGDSPPGQVKF